MAFRRRSRSVRRRPVKRMRSLKGKRVVKRRRSSKKVSFRKRALDGMSMQPSTSSNKQTKSDRITSVNQTFYADRTLYFLKINDIELFNASTQFTQPGGLQASRRISSLVDLRGWRWNMSVFNKMTMPMVLNIGIVSPKRQDVATPIGNRWFREYDSSRDNGFSTNLPGRQMCNYPINPDRYHILMHKKIRIPKCNDNAGVAWNNNGAHDSNQINRKMYIPFKRTITFEDDLDGDATIDPNVDVYAVWWVDNELAVAGDVSVNNAIEMANDIIAFFRDKI